MSGLLVKSTVIMKENLEELNQRGLAADYPVILGGAALTRAYVEQDLHEIYEGEVRYARDAFEGLRLMDALIGVKRGVPGAKLPELEAAPGAERARRRGRGAGRRRATSAPTSPPTTRCPTPPFWGTRVVKGIQLKPTTPPGWTRARCSRASGACKQARAGDGPTYEELVETEGRPRLRGLLDRLQTENLLEAAVVYGYFPCVSKGDDLIVLRRGRHRAHPLHLPAPAPRPPAVPGRLLPPARSPARPTSSASRSSPSARRIGEATGELFAANSYRDYLELHGLSVQLAEALAEYWHARVRGRAGLRRRGPRATSRTCSR